MRNKIWDWILNVSGHQEGTILPWRILWIWAVLFPLDFLAWQLNKNYGYHPELDVWMIEGVMFPWMAMRLLANSRDGETYRICRYDFGYVGYVKLERIGR